MAAYGQLGFPGEVDIDIGENSSFPHGSIVPQVIREGTLIMMDGGCTVEGYQSDITRTFVFGKPSDKMKQVFEIVHRAQTAALKTARPGVECQAVDAAARKVITRCRLRSRLQIFHSSGRTRNRNGRPRVALSRAR